MYQVTRNNRVLKSIGTGFDSYERARQALRKYIRKQVNAGKALRSDFGFWDSVSRNPVGYTGMGFDIRKVS